MRQKFFFKNSPLNIQTVESSSEISRAIYTHKYEIILLFFIIKIALTMNNLDIDEHVEEGHVYDIIVKVRETR